MIDLSWLEERIGHRFGQRDLLQRALVHSSARRAGTVTKDQVVVALSLSWLGDAILDTVVSEDLFAAHPFAKRGQLHSWRAALTSNRTLGRIAAKMELEKCMVIGPSVSLSRVTLDRHKMLATALESVVAAIYLDAGAEAARAFIRRILADDYRAVGARPP